LDSRCRGERTSRTMIKEIRMIRPEHQRKGESGGCTTDFFESKAKPAGMFKWGDEDAYCGIAKFGIGRVVLGEGLLP